MDDWDLLRSFAGHKDNRAFAEIVSRYAGFVYSTALRQVRDTHLAEDVTQAVFLILFQKAGTIGKNVLLTGWLHRTARFVCANTRRKVRLRREREEEAMGERSTGAEAEQELAEKPALLDEAIASLGSRDRDAVLAHFYHGDNFGQVAATMKISEEAARVRCFRAVEKLRVFFRKREVTSAVIAAWLSPGAMLPAPAKLVTGIMTAVEHGTFPSGVESLAKGGLKMMRMAKLKSAATIVAVVMGVVGMGGGLSLLFAQDKPAESISTKGPPPAPVAATDHFGGLPAVPSGEVEPPYRGGPYCRYHSPVSGMKFTQGVPLRVLGVGYDPDGGQGKTQKPEATEVRFFVDGKLAATAEPTPNEINHFETFLKDISIGTHVLTVESTNVGGKIAKGWPISIAVEAPVARANTINITQDVMLSGAATLTWENATVKGNGFKVRSAPNWTGSVVVRNCFVTGLGTLTDPGIDIATTAGAVTIESSIFEGTGATFLRVDGTGAFMIKNSEFRSSNLVKFVANNPDMSPVFIARGSTTGTKVFQGNQVGTGIVRFDGMSNWLIGGDTNEEGNILMGPRCVLTLINCHDIQIRGNYLNHDYQGGWSQGFNLSCYGSYNLLAEHNVIRGGSWPVQNFSGEFRYNLVVDPGHQWVRALGENSKIHHNLFIQTANINDVIAGIWLYKDSLGEEKNVAIYNNTFDGGAPSVKGFACPAVDVSSNCSLSSLRNNIFTGGTTPDNWPAVKRKPIIYGDPGTIAAADYNCFFNPQAQKTPSYLEGVASGKAGEHDINSDPKFAEGDICPYRINQAEVWNRSYKVSQVLACYRSRYAPAPGSPALNAGDPADGKNSFIGAIGSGKDAPGDLFGRFAETAKEKKK